MNTDKCTHVHMYSITVHLYEILHLIHCMATLESMQELALIHFDRVTQGALGRTWSVSGGMWQLKVWEPLLSGSPAYQAALAP